MEGWTGGRMVGWIFGRMRRIAPLASRRPSQGQRPRAARAGRPRRRPRRRRGRGRPTGRRRPRAPSLAAPAAAAAHTHRSWPAAPASCRRRWRRRRRPARRAAGARSGSRPASPPGGAPCWRGRRPSDGRRGRRRRGVAAPSRAACAWRRSAARRARARRSNRATRSGAAARAPARGHPAWPPPSARCSAPSSPPALQSHERAWGMIMMNDHDALHSSSLGAPPPAPRRSRRAGEAARRS